MRSDVSHGQRHGGKSKKVKLYILKMPQQKEYIIETDCDDTISYLKLKYGIFFSECEVSEKADIRITKSGDVFYSAAIENTVTYTANPSLYLEKFLFDNPTYNSNILALHGSAVESNGKAYIFLAPTRTGKTTLVSYLSQKGFGYITEDCILLDRSSFEVYPFPMPVHLRDGGVEVLKRYDALPSNMRLLHENEEVCRYVYTPKSCVEKPCPLGEIFYIERTRSENVILPMTTSEKIINLMRSPITPYTICPEYLQLLAKVCARYGKILKYSDMDYVKEVIENSGI